MHTSFRNLLGSILLLFFSSLNAQSSNLHSVDNELVSIPYGKSSKIIFNKTKGTYDVFEGKQRIIRAAHFQVKSGSLTLDQSSYAKINLKILPIKDQFGAGKKYVFSFLMAALPAVQQIFYVYPNRSYFFTEVVLKGNDLRSNYLSPLSSTEVNLNSKGDNRILFVPFDNDTFIRYDAKSTLLETKNISSEVGALYDNTSRKGLIVGSVEHMVWKTGVSSVGKDDQLSSLDVFGGYTDQAVTRDQIPHGFVVGDVIKSPKIFVGVYKDWRIGLEEYGAANRLAEPPFVFNWTKPVPFGWNSWGVIQEKLSFEKAIKVVDYFAEKLPEFRNGETAYIDLDSFWDNFTGGMSGDYSKLKEFADYCKRKGLEPGAYWAPFTDWGYKSGADRKAEGSDYKFSEMWTKSGDKYHDFDGARALDPTHPGTLRRIDYIIDKLKACGFKMIKIDFLGHAAAESTQFHDPKLTTGMQAYRFGMEYLVKRLDGQMLIYAAISPSMATGRYAHVRRIACDAWKTIKDTEYTLNSVNYGWWQSKLYNFIDADHIVFSKESPGSQRARLTSGLITGTLITGDDFSKPGEWDNAAQSLFQNKDLLDIARSGKAFLPLEGNTGKSANNVFYSEINGFMYIAFLNYTSASMHFNIPLSRVGLKHPTYTSRELFQLKEVLSVQFINLKVAASDAAILKIKIAKL
jgi:alpha-galactosidase